MSVYYELWLVTGDIERVEEILRDTEVPGISSYTGEPCTYYDVFLGIEIGAGVGWDTVKDDLIHLSLLGEMHGVIIGLTAWDNDDGTTWREYAVNGFYEVCAGRVSYNLPTHILAAIGREGDEALRVMMEE